MRTYLYKLTSDRGGAPCALEAPEPFLSLAICKPAIRRTAVVGDRILGITSHSLAQSDGYPLTSVIYAGIVSEVVGAQDYAAADSPFGTRPDCIYEFHQQAAAADRAHHNGRSNLHSDARHILKDLGHYPHYKNGQVLLCRDFRYFGAKAVLIPARLSLLLQAAETLGQGHRVYTEHDPESAEADALFRHLWKRQTYYTPNQVDSDAYDHSPKKRSVVDKCAPPPLTKKAKRSGPCYQVRT